MKEADLRAYAEQLEREKQELEADANRYRWLRDYAHPSRPYPRGEVWATNHLGSFLEEEALDEAIDTAIASGA